MAKFHTDLSLINIDDETWVVVSPFVFETDAGETVTVPKGFITDFASVPRLPFIFTLFGDIAHKAAVIHDYLYSTVEYPRESADKVFLSAMRISGVGVWKRYPMYWAVRAFGGAVRLEHYGV